MGHISTHQRMIGQRHCPYCNAAALEGCDHLALAVEAREFVRSCVSKCQSEGLWQTLCVRQRQRLRESGEWSSEREDFMWLETAFCDRFMKSLRWFGGLEYEWRAGPKLDAGGFWAVLSSRDPRRLWWELRDAFEKQSGPVNPQAPVVSAPWLIRPQTTIRGTARHRVLGHVNRP